MRTSLLAFCVTSCLALQAFAHIPQILNSTRRTRTLRAVVEPAEKCAPGDKGIWKCQDCDTIQYCGGGKDPDFIMPCKAQTPSKPYCTVNSALTEIADKCVSDAKVCSGTASDFTCPGEGIYPSLTDCRSYYTCNKNYDKKLIATKYMCLFNTVYNHAQKFCKFGFACHDVVTECANQFKMIPYKHDPNLYVICQPTKTPLLKQCEEGCTFYTNSSGSGCEFSCQTEGIFADPKDSTNKNFYRCFNDGKVLRKESETCPDKHFFEKEKKYCVNDPNSFGNDPNLHD